MWSMQNVFLFSGLNLIQRGRRLSEPDVCTPSWYFRSHHILKVSEMIQIWCESQNRPPPRGLRCVWALFTCSTPQGAFFSQKTPISPLQHGRPVHAVCTQECRLPLEGQPPPEDRGAVIGAPGRRSELLFFVLSGWICRPTCGPRSPRRLAYITECQTHEAQRWKWQEKPVSPFFVWSSLHLQGGSETSVCRHESSVIAPSQVTKRFTSNTRWRFCSDGQNQRRAKE